MYDIFTPEDDERFKAEMEAFNKSMETFKLELPAISDEQAAFERSVLASALTGWPSPPAPTSPARLSPVSMGPTQRISIRLPHHVIEATKREAARVGIPYQTLINHQLAIVAGRW